MNFFRFGTRFVSALSRVHFVIPVAFQYGYYLPPDRYTGDQVPYQNMNITHTVDVKGARSVQIIGYWGCKTKICNIASDWASCESPECSPFHHLSWQTFEKRLICNFSTSHWNVFQNNGKYCRMGGTYMRYFAVPSPWKNETSGFLNTGTLVLERRDKGILN